MLTLYFCPGACSMAAHIVLEESGEKYQEQQIVLANGEQRSEAYLKINPQGRVPTLVLDGGEPLAENTAILPFLGQAIWTLADGSGRRSAEFISHWLSGRQRSSLVRPYAATRTLFGRPIRVSFDRGRGSQDLRRISWEQIDTKLAGRTWFSDQYSVADPDLLVFYYW